MGPLRHCLVEMLEFSETPHVVVELKAGMPQAFKLVQQASEADKEARKGRGASLGRKKRADATSIGTYRGFAAWH